MVLSEQDCKLITAIQGGLPLCSRPYAEIARQAGMSEEAVIERISELQVDGAIKRFGIVVRHHELGYTANAMVVWDVPDDQLDRVGEQLASHKCVNLCYQRPRSLPDWPYNLFCMIHGKDRQRVEEYVDEIVKTEGLDGIPHKLLFSGRRFKQRGARYR